MIDKMKGAKWGYINENQEPEPIPEKYQELIEIREKAVAESFLKIIAKYQETQEYQVQQTLKLQRAYNCLVDNVSKFTAWVEAEISELEKGYEDNKEIISDRLSVYQKVADKINEVIDDFNQLIEE